MAQDPEAFANMIVMKFQAALAPVLERLAAAEALLKAQGDLRDRVLVVETKAATPSQPSPELGLFEKRLTAMETTQAIPTAAEIMLADVKSRLTALETRTAPELPAVLEQKTVDLSPVEQRVSRLELQYEMKAGELTPLSTAVADLTKDLGAIRERLAVVEVRPSVPGPAGEPGPPGKDGVDGKDGLAGLSFEGVYQEGQSYEKGHLVTWAGSSWHCNAPTTTKPGDGSKDWTLMVKRGRDGRDGQSAPSALPVISVGSRS
jgi:hypothetical protein